MFFSFLVAFWWTPCSPLSFLFILFVLFLLSINISFLVSYQKKENGISTILHIATRYLYLYYIHKFSMLNCYVLSGPLIWNCSKCFLNDDWLCVRVQNLDLNVDLSAASAAEE